MEDKLKLPVDVVKCWIEAVNSHDIPRIMECLHDDFQYQFNESKLSGKENVEKAWKIYLEAIPDLHLEPLLLIGSGEYVAVRFRVTGNNSGPVTSFHTAGSAIPIPNSPKPIDYNEGEFFRVQEGKILNLWNYWDTAGM